MDNLEGISSDAPRQMNVNPPSPPPSEEKDENEDEILSQLRLTYLKSNGKVDQGSLLYLLGLIDRLRMSHKLASMQTQAHKNENRTLQRYLEYFREDNKALRKTVYKLREENSNLKEKLENKQTGGKWSSLFRSLRQEILADNQGSNDEENECIKDDFDDRVERDELEELMASSTSSALQESRNMSERGSSNSSPMEDREMGPSTLLSKDRQYDLTLEGHHQTNQEVYTLTFPGKKNIGLQFQQVLADCHMNSEEVKPHKFTSKSFDQTNDDTKTKKTSNTQITMNAFLVCGFHGFDDGINTRPTFGARLIAVDDESLEGGKWTIKEFHEMIRSKMMTSSSASFTMEFRDDELNKHQRDVLNKAAAAVVKAAKSNGCNSTKSNRKSESCSSAHQTSLKDDDERDAQNKAGAEATMKVEGSDGCEPAHHIKGNPSLPVQKKLSDINEKPTCRTLISITA